MDVYSGLNVPVPVIALSLIHQAGADVAAEEYMQRVAEFHQRLLQQFDALRQRYAVWLEQRLHEAGAQVATRVLAALPADQRRETEAETRAAIRAALLENATELGIGGLLASPGSAEIVYERKVVGGDDVSKLTSDGRDYLASLGLDVGERGGVIGETIFFFRGALVYDLLEHLAPDWMTVYAGTGEHGSDQVRLRVFNAANLLFQAGALPGEATAAAAPEGGASEGQRNAGLGEAAEAVQEQEFWDGALFFEKGEGSYDDFRAELRAICEQLHRRLQLEQLSLWQRKLGSGTGKEFTLRFRVPREEVRLLNLVHTLRNSSQVGRESVVRRGKLVLGRRVI